MDKYEKYDFVHIDLGPQPRPAGEVLRDHREHTRTLGLLAGELVSLSWDDTTDGEDEDRQAFLHPAHKERCREIGMAIHEIGGLELMQAIHAGTQTMYKGPYDARILEFAWDGIGDWRA